MNSRIYPADIYTKQILRLQFGKLSCPNCYSNDIRSLKKDIWKCNSCKVRVDFKNLLTPSQLRNKKIEDILE
jgi:ribosomal protein L37AE/L43A